MSRVSLLVVIATLGSLMAASVSVTAADTPSKRARGSERSMAAARQQQRTRSFTPHGVPPYVVSTFTPVGARTVWAITAANQRHNVPHAVLRSDDGGANWSQVTPSVLSRAGGVTNINSADFVSATWAWVAYGSILGAGRQTLVMTSDGGRTWRRAGWTPSSCQVQFVNPADGWCVDPGEAGGSGTVTIYRTTTGGRSWRRVSHKALPGERGSTPDPIPFGCDKSVAFISSTDGFVASLCNGGGGYIYATTDGGARWHRRLSIPTPHGGSQGAQFTAVVANGRDAAAGYTARGYRGPNLSVVYRSVDGGRQWMAVRPPSPHRLYSASIVTPRAWRLVAGRTVLATDNAGRTWTHITANLAPGRFGPVTFVSADVGWATGALADDSDNVLHTTDSGKHWTTVHVPQ